MKSKKIIIASLIIFTISFGIRIYNINGLGITADEVTWITRGNHYIDSILEGKFIQASSSKFGAHPGIATAILIGVSEKLFKGFIGELTAARLPLILINSITPLLIFLFLVRLKKPKIGIVAALILAFDPLHISLSRIAHLDALLTFFMTATFFTYFIAEKEKKEYLKIFAGIFFGFALLTKLMAVSVLLIIIVYKIIISIKNKKLAITKFDFIALFTGFIVFYIFFTKIWLSPINGFISHIKNNFESELAGGHSNFFLGEISFSPSKWFYFVTIPIRLPEITLIFFIIGFIFSLIKFWRKNLIILLIVWFLVVIIILTSQPKMGDRYVLPIWPAISILATAGIFKVFSFIKNQKIRMSIIIIIIFIGSIFYLIKYSPNYYFFYNSLAGGAEGAKKLVVVGRGEGHRELAQYFKHKDVKVGFLGDNSLIEYYDKSGKFERLEADFEPKNYDYIAVYTSAAQRLRPDLAIAEYLNNKKPDTNIEMNGVSVFNIYKSK